MPTRLPSLAATAGLVASLTLVAAAAQAQARAPDMAAEEAKIRASRELQTQALARNDLDTVVKYWDPAITIRRALGHPVDGAQAARKLLELPPNQNASSAVVFQREATSVSVSPNWPLAFEEGRWSGHVGTVTTQPIMTGRYAAQWVKRDSVWLIRSEVFVALECAGIGCTAAALP